MSEESVEIFNIDTWFTKRDCTKIKSMLSEIHRLQNVIDESLYYIDGFNEGLNSIESHQKRLQKTINSYSKKEQKSVYEQLKPTYDISVKNHKDLNTKLQKEWDKFGKAKKTIQKKQNEYQMCLLKKKLKY